MKTKEEITTLIEDHNAPWRLINLQGFFFIYSSWEDAREVIPYTLFHYIEYLESELKRKDPSFEGKIINDQTLEDEEYDDLGC